MSELNWYVGVDWGGQSHQVCVVGGDGEVRGQNAFAHSGPGLAAMAAWIAEMVGEASAETVGVAIETPRGPVVESLLANGLAVHSINPKQLDRFRDRYSPAGAKDDRRDARVRVGAAHRPALPAPGGGVRPDRPNREWTRMREELKRERVRRPTAARALLPGVQPTTSRRPGRRPCGPPAAARGMRLSTYDKLLKKHRVRRFDAATLEPPGAAAARHRPGIGARRGDAHAPAGQASGRGRRADDRRRDAFLANSQGWQAALIMWVRLGQDQHGRPRALRGWPSTRAARVLGEHGDAERSRERPRRRPTELCSTVQMGLVQER